MRTSCVAFSSVFLVCLLITAFTGCDLRRTAPPPSPVDSTGSEKLEETLRAKIVSLKEREETLRAQIISLNKQYKNVDTRVAENQQKIKTLEKELASLQHTENRQKIEALEKELISLRQTVEIIGPDRQPSTVEKAGNRMSDDKSKKSSPPLGLTTSSPDARRLYHTAFKAYSQGNYSAAVSQFQEFIDTFPSSNMTDNAFYWIGESYYAQEDFERAISSYLKLLDRYPHGKKIPDALYKISLSHTHLKNPQKAREFLTRLMDNYPFSDAAKKAKDRLDQLE